MPYSRVELLAAVRQDHPQLAGTSDNDLFAAIAQDHPDLVKGISELQPRDYQSPKYGPTGPSAGMVASEQAANVLTGIPRAITGIPEAIPEIAATAKDIGLGALGSSRHTKSGVERVKNIVAGQAQPFVAAGKGAATLSLQNADVLREKLGLGGGSLTSLVDAPSDEEWSTAAQGAGTQLGTALLPVAAKGAARIAKPALVKSLRAGERGLKGRAEQNIMRAYDPTGKESIATAADIAPKLLERGDWGATGSRVDANAFTKLAEAEAKMTAAEANVRPGTTVSKAPLLQRIEGLIEQLKVPVEEGAISGHPDALRAVGTVYNELSRFPEAIPFEDLLKYKRQLGRAVRESGGYKETTSAADKAAMIARKQAIREVTDVLGDADDALKAANAEYHLARQAADIVEARRPELAIDRPSSELAEMAGRRAYGPAQQIPGLGTRYWDDIAATAVGGAAGTALGVGPVAGAVAGEGLNLVRQARGLRSARAQLLHKMSRGAGSMADRLGRAKAIRGR